MIGLGNMGGRIARRIRDAGLPVRRLRRRSRAQAAASGDRAGGLGRRARRRRPTSCSSRCPTAGRRGGRLRRRRAARAARPGQVVVDLSTAAPSSTVQIHAALAERGVDVRRRRHLGRRRGRRAGHADDHGRRRRRRRSTRSTPMLATFARASTTWARRLGPRGQAAEQLPQRHQPGRHRRGDGRGDARPASTCAQFLDVVNHSSGVNFATLNRFPRIVEGDYLEGGLTSDLMAKDVQALPRDLAASSDVTSFTGAAVPRRVPSRRRARLRRPDLQPRGRRDRRRRRRRAHPRTAREAT